MSLALGDHSNVFYLPALFGVPFFDKFDRVARRRAGRRDESPDVGMGGPKSLRLKNIYNINCIHEFSITPNREYFLILNFFGVRRVLEQYPGSERRAAPRFYTHRRRTSC